MEGSFTAGCSYWSRLSICNEDSKDGEMDIENGAKKMRLESWDLEKRKLASGTQKEFQSNDKASAAPHTCNQKNTRETLMMKIQEIMLGIVEDVTNDRLPTINVSNAITWKECTFNDTISLRDGSKRNRTFQLSFSREKSREDFVILVQLLAKVFRLLATNSTSTRREIYYEDTGLYGCQRRVDGGLDRVCWLLGGIPLWQLNVFATSKGLVCGQLRVHTAQSNCCQTNADQKETAVLDCSSPPGVLISSEVVHCRVRLETPADTKCLIIVEKDAAYQRLLDEGFLDRFGPCIILTGKGYPDMNTRLLVHMIWRQLALPIYALVDADPYGIEIMCVYRFGSAKLAHLCDRLAVPPVRWLGVHPKDLSVLNLSGTRQMTENDVKRATALLQRPYIANNKDISIQIEHLIDTNRKAEIEDVAKLSTGYLTDVYIPSMIAGKKFF